MIVLHFTDIHFDLNEVGLAKRFLDPLIEDIRNQRLDIGFVVITGDLLNKAGSSIGGAKRGFENFRVHFLNRITKDLGVDPEHIFFCPGNHDIDRGLDSSAIQYGLTSELISTDAVSKKIRSKDTEGVKRVTPYFEFETGFHSKTPNNSISPFGSTYLFEYDKTNIGIACLNSSWRCWNSKEEYGKLIVGKEQVLNLLEKISEAKFKIALIHHSPEWLLEFDRNDITPLLEDKFDMIFLGHVHSGSTWEKKNYSGSSIISIGQPMRACGENESHSQYLNGYSVISITSDSVEFKFRRYSKSKVTFVPNADFGNEQGVMTLARGSDQNIEQRTLIRAITNNLKTETVPDIDEHLLTYGTETKAPKTIRELFVEPVVYELVEEDKKSEKSFSLDEICFEKESTIIFGIKEIGKTIYLDRIFIEMIDSKDKFKYIPILVDFETAGNKDILNIAKDLWRCSRKDALEIINKNSICILVDNLDFKQPSEFLERLRIFVEEHPGSKIIGTSLQLLEGKIPIDIYDFPFWSACNKRHLKPFKTKEIRGLIRKWFPGSTESDSISNIKKLTQLFVSLNLPRTPLALSMFLWIFEQQDKYQPKNQATMLENFIEKTLTKHGRKEIYSDIFDYKNKERLLSDLAYQMWSFGRTNYCIRYSEALSFIENYMATRKLEITEPKKLLDLFLGKGIFVTESSPEGQTIRFRFGCFFSYFLMKKMTFDPTFCTFCLEEENYFQFLTEIEYYTGSTRDSQAILEKYLNRLDLEFEEINEHLKNNPNKFDEIFDPKNNLVVEHGERMLGQLKEVPVPTEIEMDSNNDQLLETSAHDLGIKKKTNAGSQNEKLLKLWTSAARILRYSEEIQDGELKTAAYTKILVLQAFVWPHFQSAAVE